MCGVMVTSYEKQVLLPVYTSRNYGRGSLERGSLGSQVLTVSHYKLEYNLTQQMRGCSIFEVEDISHFLMNCCVQPLITVKLGT